MKPHFNWQIDQEEGSALSGDDLTSAGSTRLRRVQWLILLLIISAGIWSAVWLVQRQKSLETQARAEVAQAFLLHRKAIDARDEELFALTLSGGDRAWRLAQKALFRGDRLRDRAQMGLTAMPGPTPLQEIVVSPDLAEAELSFTQLYSLGLETDEEAHVQLLQIMQFRHQEGRWLAAPLDESFWGPIETQELDTLLLTYPQRDADVVLRLAGDMRTAIEGVCAESDLATARGPVAGLCAGEQPLAIDFSTDIATLRDLTSLRVLADGDEGLRTVLPAPSLLGLPVDEQSYDHFARAYVNPLVQQIRTDLRAQAILPQQKIRALCFQFPTRGQRLFEYDLARATWEQESAPHAWRVLTALPDDSILLLDGGSTASFLTNVGPGRELTLQRPTHLVGARPIGWTSSSLAPRLLFQESGNAASQPRYGWLDLQSCAAATCPIVEIAGYPTVAPAGQWMLLQDGPQLILADARGVPVRDIEEGFSPFWLDAQRFGFTRFQRTAAGAVTTQIVLGDVAAPDFTVILEGDDLGEATAGALPGALFVDFVMPNPGAPRQLLISATGIRASAGEYFVFSLNLTEDGVATEPVLQLQRSGAPGGLAGVMTPTGLPPFLVSGNGRWLVMTELLGHSKETWTILLHDLQQGETRQLADTVPAMPGYFPILDWSADGEWLLVADRRALSLLAPALDFEMVVPHAFDACTAVFWTY